MHGVLLFQDEDRANREQGGLVERGARSNRDQELRQEDFESIDVPMELDPPSDGEHTVSVFRVLMYLVVGQLCVLVALGKRKAIDWIVLKRVTSFLCPIAKCREM